MANRSVPRLDAPVRSALASAPGPPRISLSLACFCPTLPGVHILLLHRAPPRWAPPQLPPCPMPVAPCTCVSPFSPPTLAAYDAPFGTKYACSGVLRVERGGLAIAKGAMLATTNDSAMQTELQKTREELHRTQIMLMQVCFSLCRLAATQDLAHRVLDRHSQACVPCCRATPHWPSMRAHAHRFQRAGP